MKQAAENPEEARTMRSLVKWTVTVAVGMALAVQPFYVEILFSNGWLLVIG